MSHKSKAFTLIELLVVIAIIGILAALVLVSLNAARNKAKDARAISDLHQAQIVAETYNSDQTRYTGFAAWPASTGMSLRYYPTDMSTLAADVLAQTGGYLYAGTLDASVSPQYYYDQTSPHTYPNTDITTIGTIGVRGVIAECQYESLVPPIDSNTLDPNLHNSPDCYNRYFTRYFAASDPGHPIQYLNPGSNYAIAVHLTGNKWKCVDNTGVERDYPSPTYPSSPNLTAVTALGYCP